MAHSLAWSLLHIQLELGMTRPEGDLEVSCTVSMSMSCVLDRGALTSIQIFAAIPGMAKEDKACRTAIPTRDVGCI